jgi:predicted transcriptional regulator
VKITLEIPDELATRLQSLEESLPRILEVGIRNLDPQSSKQFDGMTEVLEFFAALPTPEEIVAFKASDRLENRLRDLLDKNRTSSLNEAEQAEWAQYERVEHLVRIAKSKAKAKLRNAS